MQLDSTNIEVMNNAAITAKIDITKATKIIEGFYKGVIHVIKTEQTVIKIPMFGKFMYSEDWKKKKELIRLNYKDLTLM